MKEIEQKVAKITASVKAINEYKIVGSDGLHITFANIYEESIAKHEVFKDEWLKINEQERELMQLLIERANGLFNTNKYKGQQPLRAILSIYDPDNDGIQKYYIVFQNYGYDKWYRKDRWMHSGYSFEVFFNTCKSDLRADFIYPAGYGRCRGDFSIGSFDDHCIYLKQKFSDVEP